MGQRQLHFSSMGDSWENRYEEFYGKMLQNEGIKEAKSLPEREEAMVRPKEKRASESSQSLREKYKGVEEPKVQGREKRRGRGTYI